MTQSSHFCIPEAARLQKGKELALHCFIDGNDFFVSPPTGSGKSLCYWMLQAAFNLHTIELTPLARHA